MDYVFNKEKINRVLSDFYNSTGIAVGLYDGSQNGVAGCHAHSEYCAHIRQCDACVEQCSQSNLIHMKEVFSTRRINCYTCHAGLMETILPIIYEDVLIAYIQIGQFRDAEERYSSVEMLGDVATRYGLDPQDLLDLYGKLPVVSEERLQSLCHIVDILVKSFWEDGLITENRSMLSIKIEQYVDGRLSERISTEDLCNQFFLSKNALYRLFHDEFHTTVNDFIIKKRVRLAQRLLRSEAELNVTQIASLCGFPDYNYFIRLFKKQVGVTPLQFRKGG